MFHIAVGSVRYRGNADFSEFPFVRTETACEDGSANMFFFGTSSEFDGSAKIVEFLRERVDELLSFDVSVDSEDRIALLVSDMPKGTYSVMAYHGPTFENVERSLRWKKGVVAVREAEESGILGRRVIKADVVSKS